MRTWRNPTMTNNNIEDTKTLKMIRSKLNNLTFDEIKGLTSDEFQQLIRLSYLKTFVKPLPSYCPECGAALYTDEDETICSCCGLVTSASIEYVGCKKISLPHGRHG